MLVTGGLDRLWEETVAAGAEQRRSSERDREHARRRRRRSRGRFRPGELARLVEARERIPRAAFDEAISRLAEPGFSAEPYLEQEAVSDTAALEPIVDAVLAANPGQVEAYRNGKAGLLGFFVGQVMKETKGDANARVVNELVRAKLERGIAPRRQGSVDATDSGRRLARHHPTVRHGLAWLLTLVLAAAGTLLGHVLAYRLTGQPAGDGPRLPRSRAAAAARSSRRSRACPLAFTRGAKSPPAWPFPFLARLLHSWLQEHLEQLVHTGELPWLLTSRASSSAWCCSCPLALAAWALARRLLRALDASPRRVRLLGAVSLAVALPAVVRRLDRAPVPRAARGPPARPPAPLTSRARDGRGRPRLEER